MRVRGVRWGIRMLEAGQRANKIVDDVVPRGALAWEIDKELRHRIQMALYTNSTPREMKEDARREHEELKARDAAERMRPRCPTCGRQ